MRSEGKHGGEKCPGLTPRAKFSRLSSSTEPRASRHMPDGLRFMLENGNDLLNKHVQ